jgi:hypothetical protein
MPDLNNGFNITHSPEDIEINFLMMNFCFLAMSFEPISFFCLDLFDYERQYPNALFQ